MGPCIRTLKDLAPGARLRVAGEQDPYIADFEHKDQAGVVERAV
jgi:hypothetical protein